MVYKDTKFGKIGRIIRSWIKMLSRIQMKYALSDSVEC